MLYQKLAVSAFLNVLVLCTSCPASMLVLGTDADPDNLVVGNTVSFRVELTGLDVAAGETLDFLAATVNVDSSLLGPLSTPLPGAIVPDATGFLSFGASGIADGLYDNLFSISGAPISSNGVFYQFDVTPIAAGSGSLSFSFVDGLAGPVLPGPDLDFTVQPNPVPEATSLCVWSTLSLFGFGVGVYLRRRHVTH